MRTAVFTATEPRLPPMTRSTGLPADRWAYESPDSRSPWSSSARIGEPVSTALSDGRYLRSPEVTADLKGGRNADFIGQARRHIGFVYDDRDFVVLGSKDHGNCNKTALGKDYIRFMAF